MEKRNKMIYMFCMWFELKLFKEDCEPQTSDMYIKLVHKRSIRIGSKTLFTTLKKKQN